MAKFGIKYDNTFLNLYDGALCYQRDLSTTGDAEYSVSTFTLVGINTNRAKILDAVRNLTLAAHYAANQIKEVWFILQSEGEQPRRSIVSSIDVRLIDDAVFPVSLAGRGFGYYSVSIVHGLAWETNTAVSETISISARGGVASTRVIDRGDITGRIAQMVVGQTNTNHLKSCWIGFKEGMATVNSTSAIGFDPNVDVTNTHGRGADTNVIQQNWGERGKAVKITFASDTDNVFRFSNVLEAFNNTAATKPQNYPGDYRVIARYQSTSDSSVYSITLGHGHHGSIDEPKTIWLAPSVKNEEHHIELGVITIPEYPDTEKFIIKTSVGRVSGNGSLLFDTYRLIPADASIGLTANEDIDTDDVLDFYQDITTVTTGHGRTYAWSADTNHLYDFTPAEIVWGMPLDAIIVVAADTIDGVRLSDDDILDITIDSHPKFSAYGFIV